MTARHIFPPTPHPKTGLKGIYRGLAASSPNARSDEDEDDDFFAAQQQQQQQQLQRESSGWATDGPAPEEGIRCVGALLCCDGLLCR